MSRRKLNLSLGCGCLKPKLSDTFDPQPRSSATKPGKKTAKKDADDTQIGAATDSHCSYYESPMLAPASVAVEKDSDDPYLDFKESMLQMIMENEIYLKDDLRELLNCFLQLNAPYHHGIIIRAFSEIWSGMFSPRPASPSVKRVRRKARRAAV